MNNFSWMPFKYNPDGSLVLYFQNANPGAGQRSELAAGAQRAVHADNAYYAPKSNAVTGKWNPPPLIKNGDKPKTTTQ